MENIITQKKWVTPELIEYGNIATITKGTGSGAWKTVGLTDDLAETQLGPWQSCCK